ncbi:hypothetical protein [Kribbella deserti]|uniref:Uncharacterized protein n=1 Tax=Kribbella deserti TaxID=1926257 RepID=A0ABV6QEB0_9ACTN
MGVPTSDNSPMGRIKALEQQVKRLLLQFPDQFDPDDQVHDAQGNLVMGSDIDAGVGLLRPRLAWSTSTPASATVVTSTTWVEAYTVTGRRQNNRLEIRLSAAASGSGVTGQVRAIIAGTATVLPDTLTEVPDGDTVTPFWVIDVPGAYDEWVSIEVQAQRTSVSGSITVRPYGAQGD